MGIPDEFGVHKISMGVDFEGEEGRLEIVTESTYMVRDRLFGKAIEEVISSAAEKKKAVPELRNLLSEVYDFAHQSDDVKKSVEFAESRRGQFEELLDNIGVEIPEIKTAKFALKKHVPNMKQLRESLKPEESQKRRTEKESWEKGSKEYVQDNLNQSEKAQEHKQKMDEYQEDKKFVETRDRTIELDSKTNGATSTKVIRTSQELPSEVKERAQSRGYSTDQVSAAYYNGDVYIVSQNVSNADETWTHEWIAHRGLSVLFGDQLDVEMENIYKTVGVDRIHAGIPSSYHTVSHIEQAKEYLAYLAQRNQKDGKILKADRSLLERLIEKIKKLLRHIFNIALSDKELLDILADARTALLANTVTGKGTRYQLSSERIAGDLRQQSDSNRGSWDHDNPDILYQVASWHGSPYRISKLSLDNVGTGQGNQNFGWGIYVTEIEDIARDYADKLSKYRKIIVGDKSYSSSHIDISTILDWYADGRLTKEATLGHLRDIRDAITKDLKEEHNKELHDMYKRVLEQLPEFIKAVETNEHIEVQRSGRYLYKLTLFKDKDPSEYTWLDWNKPVSEKVLKAAEEELRKTMPDLSEDQYNLTGIALKPERVTGEDLYRNLERVIPWIGGASKLLLRIGIDGNRYPADSMGHGDGSKGYNYVIFDEDAITIDDTILFQTAEPVDSQNFKKWFGDWKQGPNKTILYRGLESKFEKGYETAKTDAPNGYSTWTDNPDLAREYAGKDGIVYKIELPKGSLGEEMLDADGERALFINNEKKAGLNGVSGNEYLVYVDHEDYSDDMGAPVRRLIYSRERHPVR